MMSKMNPRDQRALKLGALALILMVVVGAGPRVWQRIGELKRQVQQMEDTLRQMAGPSTEQQAGLLHVVPAFAMPRDAEHQKFLFRDRLAEQFKKIGLKEEPLNVEKAGTRSIGGFKRLDISYQGKCKFEQILDVLVALKENPYYAGVEALTIKCDPKQPPEQRREVEFNIVVSTFVKAS